MKNYVILVLLAIGSLTNAYGQESASSKKKTEMDLHNVDSILRHIVLFKFNDAATPDNIKLVEKSFANLPSKIGEIEGFEWGLNNSPENLNKGFTHSFVVTFKSEDARGIYLIHPDHLKFVEVLKPHLEDVLVIDYWTK